jgi:hypothetical protein
MNQSQRVSREEFGPNPPANGPEQIRRLWAGPGSGRPCHWCHDVIDPGQTEYEVEFVEERGARPRFHLPCLDIWRRRRSAPSPSTPISGSP